MTAGVSWLDELISRRERERAAVEHRPPSDRREFLVAAADLRARGFGLDDAARALGLTRQGVRDLWHQLDRGRERKPTARAPR